MKPKNNIVNILYNRIKNGGLNPLTNLPMTIDDIKILEYKDAVKKLLSSET